MAGNHSPVNKQGVILEVPLVFSSIPAVGRAGLGSEVMGFFAAFFYYRLFGSSLEDEALALKSLFLGRIAPVSFRD